MANPNSKVTVALLGTGTMGAPMGANIAKAGFDLRVWNRTRAKAQALASSGATVCDSPSEAARGAQIVLTMLFDAEAVSQAMESVLNDCPPRRDPLVWTQCSTVGLQGCDRLAGMAAEHDVIFVDAPVLGTRQPAEKGQLLVLASGPQEARELCEPLFDAIGTVRSWLGPAGTGSRLKLVVNAWLLAVTDATATSVAISERLGLDPALFFQTIDGGQVDCPYAHTKGEAIMARDFSANFTLEGALKDINLALEASGTEPRLAMLQGVRQDFEKSLGLGHGGEDMAAVYRALVSS